MGSKKTLFRYFLFFFFLSFLIFNWSKISWFFYPSYAFRVFSFYLFEKPKEEKFKSQEGEKNFKIENSSINGTKEEQKQEESVKAIGWQEEIYEKEDSIEIEKIKISAPLILVKKKEDVQNSLDRGVVLWPDSVFPGQKGQTIILGHSAPPNWPKIKYDWVFSNLNLLEKGDEIVIFFQKRKYTFTVEEKIFLNRGQELPKTDPEKSILFLISCWPPGKDLRRIAIEATLKS